MEDDGSSRKRSQGGRGASPGSLSAAQDAAEVDVFAVDDQAVLLELRVPLEGEKEHLLTLRFQRLTKSDVVTVEAEKVPTSMLACLFPGDTGASYPKSASVHAALAGGEADSGDAHYPPGSAARPFVWVQWLAGIACLPEQQTTQLEPSTRAILQRIETRVRTSVALGGQLRSLADCAAASASARGMVQVHPSATALFPTGSASSAWTLGAWAELAESDHPSPTALFAKDAAGRSKGARYFKATFKLKLAAVEAVIQLGHDYPDTAPTVVLQRTTTEPGASDSDLRDMEVEVNGHYDELVTEDPASWDFLLCHQLRRIQEILGGAAKGKRRGRNRRLPMSYSARHGHYHR